MIDVRPTRKGLLRVRVETGGACVENLVRPDEDVYAAVAGLISYRLSGQAFSRFLDFMGATSPRHLGRSPGKGGE